MRIFYLQSKQRQPLRLRLSFNFQYKPSSYSFSQQTLSRKFLWEKSFSRAWCHLPLTSILFYKEKFPQLLFHPFTDKTTPLLLIKHFCAQTSKLILFTLNLTPNKGKWVNHFEVICNVLFTSFFSRDTLQWRLLNPVYSNGKKRLVCAARGSVLMFN